jgi:hypothetical protein
MRNAEEKQLSKAIDSRRYTDVVNPFLYSGNSLNKGISLHCGQALKYLQKKNNLLGSLKHSVTGCNLIY